MTKYTQKSHRMIPRICRKICAAGMILVTLLSFSGCSAKPQGLNKYSYDCWGSFDTVITIMGYCENQKEFDRRAGLAEARFLELHKLYDKYNDYPGINNVRTINSEAGISPVKVEPELYSLIKAGLDWQAAAPPAVNIAMGPVLEVWHDYRAAAALDPDHAAIPSMEELTEASRLTDSSRIILDQTEQTVFLADSGMQLDVGAIAKGYAAELVAQELKEAGWDSFIISSGGNIRAGGKPEDGVRDTWSIGIANITPVEEGETADIIETVYLTDQSVVTSGDYQRYYMVDGIRYHHIIDPATLMPAHYFRSVTVITSDSGYADFLSTAFFILPYEKGADFAGTLENVEVMWVFSDGSIKTTSGMRQYIKNEEAQK